MVTKNGDKNGDNSNIHAASLYLAGKPTLPGDPEEQVFLPDSIGCFSP